MLSEFSMDSGVVPLALTLQARTGIKGTDVFHERQTHVDHTSRDFKIQTQTSSKRNLNTSVKPIDIKSKTGKIRSSADAKNVTIAIIQSRRKEVLRRVCKNIKHIRYPQKEYARSLKYLMVDDKHKVLYCYVSKVGTTTWLSMLSRDLHASSNKAPNLLRSQMVRGIRELKSYNPTEIRLRLSKYYKFLFVRHPLTRIVSAFRDKLLHDSDQSRRYLPRILKYTRNIDSSEVNNSLNARSLTFSEFLAYTYTSGKIIRTDQHWENIYRLCNPCGIRYDYIGKKETFHQDAIHIIHNIFKSDITQIEKENWTGSNDTLAKRFFSSVPARLRREVIRQYKVDAQMFGYDMTDYY